PNKPPTSRLPKLLHWSTLYPSPKPTTCFNCHRGSIDRPYTRRTRIRATPKSCRSSNLTLTSLLSMSEFKAKGSAL
ncbi:hypothetical protein HHX47_DHR3000416, partial [Lentinula edodes]